MTDINWNDPESVNAAIAEMVNRFLTKRLPGDFQPDGGITFAPYANPNSPHAIRRFPTGTNLFTATQAEEMLRHILEPYLPKPVDPLAEIFADAFKGIHLPRGWAPIYSHILEEITKRGGTILWGNGDE